MKYLWLGLLFYRLLHGEGEFFQWMGKETPHWVHVSQAEDLNTLEKFSELYEKHKDLRFTEEGPYKIPKILHFIWLGPRPFPPQSVQNVRTWLAHHPDWKVKFWTDRQRLPPCQGMEVCKTENFPFLFLKQCFEESENWGEKSDILRFEILYQEGGTYVDHDANCLKKFDGLHRGYDFYCGLESPHPPFAGRRITSGNGVIGSRPSHPVLLQVIERMGKQWKELGWKYRGRDGYSRTQLVMERTYIQLTESILQGLCKEGNIDIVFPAAFFFAKKGIPPLYSRHFFANSWADEGKGEGEFEKKAKRTMGKLRHRNQHIRWISKGALFANLAILVVTTLFFMRKKRGQPQ